MIQFSDTERLKVASAFALFASIFCGMLAQQAFNRRFWLAFVANLFFMAVNSYETVYLLARLSGTR